MKITSKQKGFRSYFDLSPQIPTRMKIAALCLTCFLSAANANSLYSQSARLSIEMNNVSIEEVLNKIEENSEFHFIYNNELVNVDRKVNVKFDNETIESILKKVFTPNANAEKINVFILLVFKVYIIVLFVSKFHRYIHPVSFSNSLPSNSLP